ncbi:hypothetical protein [Dactylosporangium sp. CA-233914]|uniref:hypothetical protein n=1 Tax=Dactylosporangium sp. CA-233914 TaxID=3239934 RepID=UPI003D9465F5
MVVLSPHQNNFHMPLRVECWHRRPPDDTDQWEEVTECAFTVEAGELRYESPALDTTACAVPDGQYAVRICGRGFVNRGWPGSTKPGDVWRIQLWPASDEVADRRIKHGNPESTPEQDRASCPTARQYTIGGLEPQPGQSGSRPA